MATMHYRIVEATGIPVISIMDPGCIECASSCGSESEIVPACGSRARRRRGAKTTTQGVAFLCTDQIDYVESSKLFKRHLAFLSAMAAEYAQIKAEISRREFDKSTNLLHNLVKLNALELQELYALMPQDQLAGSFKDQTHLVAEIVEREPRETAGVLLRLLKNSVSVKNEFAVYQMLYNESPKLSVAAHYVHKVIFNVVPSFLSINE
jgi:hypothetical protein